MKTMIRLLLTLNCCWLAGGAMAQAADTPSTNAGPVRIGVYDSRAVAYAWFSSEEHQAWIKRQMQAARAAKAEGQTNHWQQLGTALRQHQEEMHREVFSTAPATNALVVLQQQLPEIKKQAGAVALVSQWDDETLRQYPNAEKVDVTDQLVREFKPAETQLKVIADLRRQKPLSLEKCDELIRKGEI